MDEREGWGCTVRIEKEGGIIHAVLPFGTCWMESMYSAGRFRVGHPVKCTVLLRMPITFPLTLDQDREEIGIQSHSYALRGNNSLQSIE